MTETIILALLITAGVWVARIIRRAWRRLRGIEHDPGSEGPLPIVRVWHLVRKWWVGMQSWVRRRCCPRAGSAEME
ncbi:MAG: hypothetical protein J7M38_00960 [Armatimonadetes bacterium]|nr:hypothetical protein [Armatimonadota bacterium]